MGEQWIEAFRGDTRASRGISAAHLAEVADDDFDANPRGLCFGHPKSDEPAAGRVTGAKVEGNRLLVKVADLTTKAIEGIKSGAWLNRSAAFFDPDHEANPRPGKWTLRHVGLLGASAPGIPGMKPLRSAFSFDADGDLVAEGDPAEAVIFAAAPTTIRYVFDSKEPDMADVTTAPTPEELRQREEKLKADELAFEARQTTAFQAGNAALVDGLVAAGKVLPAEVDRLKLVFNALDREELTFSATDKGTASAALASFLSTAIGKRVPVDTGRESPSKEFDAKDKPTDPAAITAAANQLVKDKGLTFEAAVAEVTGEK
jgi:hypothetical protein